MNSNNNIYMQHQPNNQQQQQQQHIITAVAAEANSQSQNIPYRISGSSGGASHHTIFVPPQATSNIYPVPSSTIQRHENVNYYVQQQVQQQQHQPQLTQSGNIRAAAATTITVPTSTTINVISQHQMASQHQQQRNRKLQVDDALSYLERVRQQFAQTPEKYNEFLEVMKDFKSHAIDTHGVLERVSKLFQAYPNLIDGFNTFLPPGFEVHVRGNCIEIIEPDGTKQLINNGQPLIETIGGPASSADVLIQQVNVQQNQYYQQQQEHILTNPIVCQNNNNLTHPQNSGPKVMTVSSTTHIPTEQLYKQMPIVVNTNAEILPQQQSQHMAKQVQATFLHTSAPQPPPLQLQQSHLKQATVLSSAAQQQLKNILEAHHHQQQQQQTMVTQITDVSNYQFQQQQQSQLSMGAPSTIVIGQTQQQPDQVQTQQQPIHFDQALGYLHKIKERFLSKPEIYHQFLAILSNYQRANDSTQKLTESAVYKEVARLFSGEADLMHDFQSFLPDADLELSNLPVREYSSVSQPLQRDLAENDSHKNSMTTSGVTATSNVAICSGSNTITGNITSMAENFTNKKRTGNAHIGEHPATKKAKNQVSITYEKSASEIVNDIDIPLEKFIFFEKVHRALQSESVYKNFVRFLGLYTKSILSGNELVERITPFLASYPELLKEFKDILGGKSEIARQPRMQIPLEERIPSEKASHIDFATAQVLGVSYRRLPDSYEQPKRTGRDELCKKVLNDHWVSYPEWIGSEDCNSVTSKKTCFEEVLYRTEEERFEVDMLIEVNSTAINALDYAHREIKNLNEVNARKWMCENEGRLNCSYTVISRAIKKLYGEYANKMLCALRDKPLGAIPQVLMRMRSKDAEWRKIREEYNVIWQDQMEKNYMKSLDHQSIAFKANDARNIRSKSISKQLENIYNERIEKADQGLPVEYGPQLAIEYPRDRQMFHDANELIIHYVKRQNPREKKGIIQLLKSLIPQLFMLSVPNSNNQTEDQTQIGQLGGSRISDDPDQQQLEENQQLRTKRGRPKQLEIVKYNCDTNEEGNLKQNIGTEHKLQNNDESLSGKNATCEQISSSLRPHQLRYTMFLGTNCWLLFIRLHAILCDRLAIIKRHNDELINEYNEEIKFRQRQKEVYEKYGNSVEFSHPLNAVDVYKGLRELKKPLQNPENFYQIMLQEMKNLLDQTVDISSFEDSMRSMFDIKAYVLFTMDRLVSTITSHLKNCIVENGNLNYIKLFHEYYKKRINDYEQGELSKHASLAYENSAEKLFINQSCYKMYFFNDIHPIVTVELIDTDEPESDSENEEEEKKESENVVALPDWQAFLKERNSDNLYDIPSGLKSRLFLKRNLHYRLTVSEILRSSFDSTDNIVKGAGTSVRWKIPHFFVSHVYCHVLKQNLPAHEVLYRLTMDEQYGYVHNYFSDFIIRKGAPGMFNKKNHRKVYLKRRRKLENWQEKRQRGQELSARWLTTECITQYCQHPRFKYLKYTKYLSKNA